MRRRSGCVKTFRRLSCGTPSQTAWRTYTRPCGAWRNVFPRVVSRCTAMPCARVRKGSVAIWDAACRVKLGRIGPCRRRRWEPFRAPCACTGVMLPIHRVSDGSMLFPTGSGGGNDSRIAAICRGDLCDMACNRSRLSFPARRNDAGGKETAEIRSGASREYFGSFRPRCHASWSLVGKRYLWKVCRVHSRGFETRRIRVDASLTLRGICESMFPFVFVLIFFVA